MKNENFPVMCDFGSGNGTVVKSLMCDPTDGTESVGVGVKEIGYGISPCGKRRVMLRGAYMLQFITDGCGSFCGKRFAAGDVLFSVPGEPEIRETGDGERYSCAWITFVGDRAERLIAAECGIAEEGRMKNTVFPCRRGAEAAEYLRNAAHLAYGERHGAQLLSVLFGVLSMLDAKTRETKASYIETARRYMRENCGLPIKASDVARAVSLSQNYLCRLFVRNTGHSIKKELTLLRLEYAKKLLENEKLSVADVSYAAGFADEKHFAEVFRRTVGVPPSKYRLSVKRRVCDVPTQNLPSKHT